MSPATPPPASGAITPDDLFRMGAEGERHELVAGQLVEKKSSLLSSYVAGEVFSALAEYTETGNFGWVIPGGATYQCFPDDPSKVRRASTVFFTFARMSVEKAKAKGHCTICPELVVEVASPNDLAHEMNRRRREWLSAGALLVWVIDPKAKEVHIYRADGSVSLLREADTLTGDPVLPGFAVPVAELFRLPPSKPTQTG